ncbi:hypothetical protein CMI47_03180 [Candidatus Pacearchaeota archaeon]|nr:hypothetical protein [Candidatus Pacearchaeota archaeon]|tara:strand:+ start:1400 stop:6595 length:5196 start_codon:yes stop_codon:yes gene_type:complete
MAARDPSDIYKAASLTFQKAKTNIMEGTDPFHVSLVGTGASVFLDQNHANSITPDTRNIVAMSPEATILVKKKVFSALRSANDLRYIDKTEKMLLRATKALFAYKVQQIRAYESLSKFESFYEDNHMYSMNLLSSFIKEASLLDLDKLGFTAEEYAEKKLQEWLDESMGKYLETNDGTVITFDAETGQFSQASIELPTQPFASPFGTGPTGSSGPSVMLEARESITNREYIQSLPASQAKAIMSNKKNEFKAEYEGIDGSASALSNASEDLSISADTFFGDVADVLGFAASAENYNAMNEDITEVLRRNAFSTDSYLTRWIVDPDAEENYIIGPGTGVIEVALFNNFTTSTNYNSSPSTASFAMTYPYRIGTVLEDDIEVAIEEALYGTVGILEDMMNGGFRTEGMGTISGPQESTMPPIDGASVISAALELGGAGSMDSSLDTDYIRDRLRTFYLGKPFINPPDPVHFYIRGNRTFTDYTDLGSSYPEEASEAPFDSGYLEIDDVILKAEYQLYTTQSISYEQYKSIRKAQDSSFGMIHVFGGFVTNTSETFGGGYWTLNVSCTDNMSWLNWSRFAIQPSLSDPKNMLEDPLTPFELVKDELGQVVSSEKDLLYENKLLLDTGLLSFDSGLFAGQNVTEGNLLQGQYNGMGSSGGKKILQHPNGFVYRWKTGIVTATGGFQAVDPTGENQAASTQFSQRYSVTAAQDVLNNLDIPNILSILIVGQPYNIETFIEQSFAAHNKKDKSVNLSPDDPLTGVVEAVRKQNEFYGNFHPYRMLSVSSASAEQMMNQAGIREVANNNVKSLQKRKVKIRKKIRDLNKSLKAGAETGIPASALISTLEAEIATIDGAIQNQVRTGMQANSSLTAADDVGIQISLSGLAQVGEALVSGDEDENHDITRGMMLVGAQRRIEDVRLNRDRNLFIVSDQYDMADIRPFIMNLNNSGWKLFDSTYVDVFQKCSAATSMLHLEFFCNTQGHLEFRPPLWNRVPISVLKEVIKLQEDTDVSIMPSFITDLFQTRIEGLYLQVHTLNVKIVLISLMMGKYPDLYLIPNMKLSGPDSLEFFGVKAPSGQASAGSGFLGSIGSFLTASSGQTGALQLDMMEYQNSTGDLVEQNNSLFGDGLQVTASFQEKGDILGGDTESLLGSFDPIFQEDVGAFDDLLTMAASAGKGRNFRPPAQHLAKPGNLNAIRNTFKKEFGRDPAQGLGIDMVNGFHNDNFVHMMDADDIDNVLLGSDGLLTKLKKAISDRDSYVSMLQANIAKQEELEEIEVFLGTGEEADDITSSEGLLSGATDFLEKLATSIQNTVEIITGKVAEGTVYDHLLEDDSRNLLGYGSGKRFILKDEYIINATFTENPPDFTRVDVKGDAPLGLGEGLNSAVDGLYFWAGATDFDLWRQYGYKSGGEISLPFVSDAEGQARPYAILELILQKMSINKASVTIAGNEFYQPGDTVYVPSKGLLYYVASVNHTFTYGSSFTTQLGLVYGHPAGQYVPSPLDVIGQSLVSNFLEDPALVYRTQGSDDNYRVLKPDSTLAFSSGEASVSGLLSHKDNQRRFTNMMVDMTGSLSASKYVLIRGFAKNEDDKEGIALANQRLAVVRSLLESPSQISQDNELHSMRLPNNMPVISVSSTKIIEQVSYLERGEETNPVGEIKCMDRQLASIFKTGETTKNKDGSVLREGADLGVFPKGGPLQGSWFDIREEMMASKKGEIKIVEVGIIDIPNSLFETVV